MPAVPAELDPADPYAREAQTFPRVDSEMAARIKQFGSEEDVSAGAMLFERGQRGVDFFLIVAGAVEVFETDICGETNLITVHTPRQFAGEMDLFNDRQILVSARATEATRVVRVKRADFRRLVASEPDIGEVIMRAFILRRVGMIRHGHGVALVGPGHGADTQRIQAFMTRNNFPHRVLNTEADPAAGGFLECFHLAQEQLPVLILPGGERSSTQAMARWPNRSDSWRRSTRTSPSTSQWSAPGPQVWRPPYMPPRKASRRLALESVAPGGQAGTSSKIENYLGFPTGISGGKRSPDAHRVRRKNLARASRSHDP